MHKSVIPIYRGRTFRQIFNQLSTSKLNDALELFTLICIRCRLREKSSLAQHLRDFCDSTFARLCSAHLQSGPQVFPLLNVPAGPFGT